MNELPPSTFPQYPDGRLDTKHAAEYLGLSVKTLAIKRSNGTGPKFINTGRIFYYADDLNNWLKRCDKVSSTAEARIKRKTTSIKG